MVFTLKISLCFSDGKKIIIHSYLAVLIIKRTWVRFLTGDQLFDHRINTCIWEPCLPNETISRRSQQPKNLSSSLIVIPLHYTHKPKSSWEHPLIWKINLQTNFFRAWSILCNPQHLWPAPAALNRPLAPAQLSMKVQIQSSLTRIWMTLEPHPLTLQYSLPNQGNTKIWCRRPSETP